jgi:hypothetical protein
MMYRPTTAYPRQPKCRTRACAAVAPALRCPERDLVSCQSQLCRPRRVIEGLFPGGCGGVSVAGFVGHLSAFAVAGLPGNGDEARAMNHWRDEGKVSC